MPIHITFIAVGQVWTNDCHRSEKVRITEIDRYGSVHYHRIDQPPINRFMNWLPRNDFAYDFHRAPQKPTVGKASKARK
jgi:hypothetical protein